jgi:hypothetical protein
MRPQPMTATGSGDDEGKADDGVEFAVKKPPTNQYANTGLRRKRIARAGIMPGASHLQLRATVAAIASCLARVFFVFFVFFVAIFLLEEKLGALNALKGDSRRIPNTKKLAVVPV